MKGLIISDTRKAEVVEIDKPVLTGHNNVLVEASLGVSHMRFLQY